jgi:hypothetical protein
VSDLAGLLPILLRLIMLGLLVCIERYESTSGGEREIQRTMLELLNQLDGFDTRGDVKVIMATNKVRQVRCFLQVWKHTENDPLVALSD